ncbi:ATP-binding protein [Novosphingopyxis baekryungensis]|uniref:ATP-binding protein n=1 Tax=Novosphingopyxis baekryungensis TaxID=279369 RepID=UPI0004230789|nr:ATP-binding protein [Novosphingopyxis baekryungensis]
MSLTTRILAVNIFAIVLLAGGLFFLDSYRSQLLEIRSQALLRELDSVAQALVLLPASRRDAYLTEVAVALESRLRLYDASGAKIADSFLLAPPTYDVAQRDQIPLRRIMAREIDVVTDALVGSPAPPDYVDPQPDRADDWPEIAAASDIGRSVARQGPDGAYVLSAARQTADGALLLTTRAADIRGIIREERLTITLFSIAVLLVSIWLSLFLARTIVRPLRLLARNAVKVRLGFAREVSIPRLPSRRDEIGMLARAVSDMSNALRGRIDATEAFAADVAHEVKNPLASLRSALESLQMVTDEGLRAQLFEIASSDVRRLDRLISDISEASRVDSQLSRAKFDQIDMAQMVAQLLDARRQRATDPDVTLRFVGPAGGTALVMGEDVRLERVLENLIDNAVSFSPTGGTVEILVSKTAREVVIRVMDEGPGVPPDQRDAVFERFHSRRPADEAFGKHSGLGLAIARTIINGHQGSIQTVDRFDRQGGACFEIRLPRADPPA